MNYESRHRILSNLNGLAKAALTAALLFSCLTGRGQWGWGYEIPAHFLPSVPSSSSGRVSYEYEFYGLSFGDNACTAPSQEIKARTREWATVGGNYVTNHAVVEVYGPRDYYCSTEPPTQIRFHCSQAVNDMVSPPLFTPNQDAGDCSYTNGAFFLFWNPDFDKTVPACYNLVETNFSGPNGSWSLTYTYAAQPRPCYYYNSRSCSCDPPNPPTWTQIQYGWGAYYKIHLEIEQGVAAPSLPAMPGPASVGQSQCANVTTLVTSVNSFGALRNDDSGWVGFQFRVGATPIKVTELGRWVVSGNTQSHTLQLFNANGTAVPGSTVILDTAGQSAGQFAYSHLASPITLAANATYAVMSYEVAGGDRWYDYWGTQITLNPVASSAAAVWAYTPPPYNLATSGSGQSYGPVNVKLCQ